MENKHVTNVTVTHNTSLIVIDILPTDVELLCNIFENLSKKQINIDMISLTPPYRSNLSVSFTISDEDIVKTLSVINAFKPYKPYIRTEVDANNTKISIFDEKMKYTPGIASRVFNALYKNNIDIKLITTSEVDISLLIFDNDTDKAITALSKEFNLS